MTWPRRLFAINGLLPPALYWPAAALLFALQLSVSASQFAPPPYLMVLAPLGSLLGLVLTWMLIALSVKRLHDAGRSGWWTAAYFVVGGIVGIAAVMVLMGPLYGQMFQDPDAVDVFAVQEQFRTALLPAVFFGAAVLAAWLVGLGLQPTAPLPHDYDGRARIARTPPPADWRHMFFSFNGRIPRQRYWIAIVILVAARTVLSIIPLLGLLLNLAALWPDMAVKAKRLHDLNRSGWWIAAACGVWWLSIAAGLTVIIAAAARAAPGAEPPMGTIFSAMGVMMIAFVADLAFTVVIGALPGKPGPNRFGPDPFGEAIEDVF